MNRLLLISKQIPVKIQKFSDGFILESSQTLSMSGLKNFYKRFEPCWIGQTGLEDHYFTSVEKKKLTDSLKQHNCIPVFPDLDDYHLSLHGFSRNTLWPIFHYFVQNVSYTENTWQAYRRVNQLYADTICDLIEDGDTIWIHDFHLLLLPSLIKKKIPDVSIGIFIHIPFPSFEIFRLLPWRVEILEGMLGADLIGFQTYDYVRHFMSCVRRLLGYETVFNRITVGERTMITDAFPRGIFFDKIQSIAKGTETPGKKRKTKIQKEIENYLLKDSDKKYILSIDPLDYTKGISHRIKAFDLFLQNYPQYLEKVSLMILAMPSGESGQRFHEIKREVDELVGKINGSYGTITWTPMIYINQTFPVNELISLYANSDIALIVPLRDGMNLVAKEYVASRKNGEGVLILSELAGASKELHEALIVNPNDLNEISAAIKEALEMPVQEQVRRNEVMASRLKRYTIERWANEFINTLGGVKELQKTSLTRKIDPKRVSEIKKHYQNSKEKIIFLDYDGTLSWFKKDPEEARPDKELYGILNGLASDPDSTLVIISGRDKETLSRWFDNSWNIHFVAEHGVWLREPGSDWHMMEQIDNLWKKSILPILEYYVDQTPLSFVEKKNFSLVWHYRKADPDLGIQRAWELKEQLRTLTSNLNLEIMDGDKVLEIKYSGINKGRAALHKMGEYDYDFILAIGDDWTDEYTFEAMPEEAYTIKVGAKTTRASFYIESVDQVREMLISLIGK